MFLKHRPTRGIIKTEIRSSDNRENFVVRAKGDRFNLCIKAFQFPNRPPGKDLSDDHWPACSRDRQK